MRGNGLTIMINNWNQGFLTMIKDKLIWHIYLLFYVHPGVIMQKVNYCNYYQSYYHCVAL